MWRRGGNLLVDGKGPHVVGTMQCHQFRKGNAMNRVTKPVLAIGVASCLVILPGTLIGQIIFPPDCGIPKNTYCGGVQQSICDCIDSTTCTNSFTSVADDFSWDPMPTYELTTRSVFCALVYSCRPWWPCSVWGCDQDPNPTAINANRIIARGPCP